MVSDKGGKIEILAPAGSVEGMKAAFHAGADAVYMGGSRFGARAYADNPDEEDLKWAIDYAHIHQKKLYLTLNTLMKDNELEEEVYEFLNPYYKEGLDAVIIQDFGVFSMLRQSFPDLPLHASTQMTITGVDMAKWLENQGMERIVLSRELSLEEIQKIREKTGMELEVFVQGALCYCYSGQCLMSSMIGGRSGNRGRCAQPCRLPYQAGDDKYGSFLLSPKDICTLRDIPELVECGINSFKIEGRMKKPEYAALTAMLYRHYTDLYQEYGKEKFQINEKDVERLMDLYNRGGFSGGYLHQNNSADMIFTKRPNHMGVPVGTVSEKGDVRTSVDLKSGDVLEIRGKDGKEVIQWTLNQSVPEGASFWPDTGKRGTSSRTERGRKNSPSRKGIGNKNKENRMIPGMTVFRMRNPSLIEEIHENHVRQELKENIYGRLRVVKDSPVMLTLKWKDISVSLEGERAEAAKNQSMLEEQLKKPIQKTGNTPFVFEMLEVETDGLCFVPNQQLNALRREALKALEKTYLKKFLRLGEKTDPALGVEGLERSFDGQRSEKEDVPLSVMLTGPEILKRGRILTSYETVSRVYVELHEAVHEHFETVKLLKRAGKKIYFSLPGIVREKDREVLVKYMTDAGKFADGWLVRQMEAFLLVRSVYEEAEIVFDSSIYSMNHFAKKFLQRFGRVKLTAPVELNYQELKKLGCEDMELTVYGHQQLMVSAQCVKKTKEGCTQRPEMLQLTDRQYKHFYVYNECEFCYNKIYNGLPTMLMDKKRELQNLHPASFRIHFTMENEGQISALLKSFQEIFREGAAEKNILKDFTRGHFARGLE